MVLDQKREGTETFVVVFRHHNDLFILCVVFGVLVLFQKSQLLSSEESCSVALSKVHHAEPGRGMNQDKLSLPDMKLHLLRFAILLPFG